MILGLLLIAAVLSISGMAVTAPAGWTQVSPPPAGDDVFFREPTGAAVIDVIAASDSGASNTQTYVLQVAQGVLQALEGKGWTQVTAPQSGSIAARPAAWFTATNNAQGVTEEVFVFSSQYFHITYAIEMGSSSVSFTTFQSTWDSTAGSFVVDGEGGLGAAQIAGIIVGIVAVVIVAVFALTKLRRRAPRLPPTPPAYDARLGPGAVTPGYPQPPSVSLGFPPIYPSTPENVPPPVSAAPPANPLPVYRAPPDNLPPGSPASPSPGFGPVRQNFCLKCGVPLAPGSAFCGACGARLE